MAVTIGSNIASLRTQRQLSQAADDLSRNFERLSSGQRINRASDDAAGLAIASSLRADARIFNQAQRNLNDGLSALNIAEGAYEALGNIVVRMRELTFQAANGIYSDEQRTPLDNELQALRLEYLRVIETTTFNGKQLLTDDSGSLTLQAGRGSHAVLEHTFSSLTSRNVGTGTFTISGTYAHGDTAQTVTLGDIDNDGDLDFVGAGGNDSRARVYRNNGDGTFGSTVDYVDGPGYDTALTDLDQDGNLDLLISIDDNGSSLRSLVVRRGAGDGTFGAATSYGPAPGDGRNFFVGDFTGDGVTDIVQQTITDGALLFTGTGTGTLNAPQSLSLTGGLTAAGDINGDGTMDLVT